LNARGLLHLLIVYIVWGSTYLAIRIAVREGAGFPAFVMAGSRVFIAALILFAWARLARRALKPTRRDWWVFASSGVLLWLGGNGLVSWAEQRADSAYAALLVASLPIWTTILDSFIDRRPPSFRLIGSLLIGISGIAVLNAPVLMHGTHADVVAAAALLGAVFSWGIGSVIQKRNPVSLSAEASSAYQLMFGSVCLLAASALIGEPRPTPTPDALWAWGYLILFGSVIAFTSFVKALQMLPTHVVTTYAYVNPVIAVILGWLILDEPVTLWMLGGSALVILGVAGIFHDQRVNAARARVAAAK